MIFDAPECIYHYYLLVENSAMVTASSSLFTSSLHFAMQLKLRNQQFCLVIKSDTLQTITIQDFEALTVLILPMLILSVLITIIAVLYF